MVKSTLFLKSRKEVDYFLKWNVQGIRAGSKNLSGQFSKRKLPKR